jgi:hypothetical protein
MTQPLTKAELLAKLKANPRFREVKGGEAIIIVGARPTTAVTPNNTLSGPEPRKEAEKP